MPILDRLKAGGSVYFYELHESDDELFSEALLAHDSEYDENEFLELVQEARRDVIDNFEEDSLIEAVANQLQRTHGFVHIDDRQLRAAVRVSANEGETELTSVSELGAPRTEDAEDEFRTLLVDVEPDDAAWRN
jgi:hypothetical protein